MAAFAAAKTQIGVPYVWGGESAGRRLRLLGAHPVVVGPGGRLDPEDRRRAVVRRSRHVSLTALQPGDLLFYYNLDGDDQVDHVVMYGGSGPFGTQTTIAADYTGHDDRSSQPAFTYGLIGAARP